MANNGDDDCSALVFDCGTQTIKAGPAGDDTPREIDLSCWTYSIGYPPSALSTI